NIMVYPSTDNGWITTTRGQVSAKQSSHGTGFLYKFSTGCGYSVNISPNTKQSVCKTGTVAFEVTQPNLDLSFGLPSTDYVIQWVKDNQSVATNTLTYTGTQAGEYFARITQGNCVNNSAKVIVDVLGNTAPTITSDITELCANGGASVTLASNGCANTSITRWSNNTSGISISVSPNATTNYTAQCVDTYVENGVSKTCTSSPSNTQGVTILTTSNLNIPSGIISADAICQGTSEALDITVNGDISAPLTYLWTRDNASISSQPTFNASTAGNYRVTVKDKRGCSAQSGVKELKLIGTKVPTVTSSIAEICRNSGITPTLTATGCTSSAISWNTQATTPTIRVSPTSTTQYSSRCVDTFTAANGAAKTCFGTNSQTQVVTVRQQSNITITDLFARDVFCKNDFQDTIRTEVRNFASPLVFNWYKNGTLVSNGLEIIVSDAGNYQLKVRDARGCTRESQVKSIAQSALELSITGNQAFCEGTTTSLQVTAANGIGIPTFEWRLGNQALSTTNAITVSLPGNYNVRATDNKGCQEIVGIPVVLHPKIVADYKKSAKVKGNLLYSFNNDLLSGGKKPFNITLTATSATNKPVSVSQNNIGKFSESSTIFVKVKDANGCDFSDNIQINHVPCDVALTVSGDTSFCYYDKVALQANQLSGIAPFTYSWTVADATIPNKDSPLINAEIQGIYRATVTDSANCTVTSGPYSIRERGRDILAFIRSNGDSTAYFPFGVDINATTQADVTYQWFRNDTLVIDQVTPIFKANQTGNYKVKVSKNGCFNNSNEIRVTILIPLSSEPTASIRDVTAFPNPTDELFVIKSATKTPLKSTCRIVNMQGSEVYSETKPYAATEHEWQINASQWVAGTYVYRITTTNGEASGKIIKR
ncbi:MAG: T9SS type A sorting domain-containing protein, partial [Spirosomataceae bacterium]